MKTNRASIAYNNVPHRHLNFSFLYTLSRLPMQVPRSSHIDEHPSGVERINHHSIMMTEIMYMKNGTSS